MQGTGETNELDNWRFERIYTHLFSVKVEHLSAREEDWRYDPLDSKYPTIDGILRRERKDGQYNHAPEFALIQLKGTRFEQGKDPWPKLKDLFLKNRDGKPNPIAEVTSVALSCPALLIGLSVDINSEPYRIEAAYIGASEGIPENRKPESWIEPDNLAKTFAEILDALRSPKQPTEARRVIFPRAKELVYFNKKQNGTVSVGESGIIFGRNISINWTIPQVIKTISVTTISGSPEICMEPVALPHPPYNRHYGLLHLGRDLSKKAA